MRSFLVTTHGPSEEFDVSADRFEISEDWVTFFYTSGDEEIRPLVVRTGHIVAIQDVTVA